MFLYPGWSLSVSGSAPSRLGERGWGPPLRLQRHSGGEVSMSVQALALFGGMDVLLCSLHHIFFADLVRQLASCTMVSVEGGSDA